MEQVRIFNASCGEKLRQRGQALALTIFLVSLAGASAIAVAFLAKREVDIATDIKFAAIAIAAADGGVEEALYQFWRNNENRNCLTLSSGSCVFSQLLLLGGGARAGYEATYNLVGTDADGNGVIDPGSRFIRSRGSFPCPSLPCSAEGVVQRAFEVTF